MLPRLSVCLLLTSKTGLLGAFDGFLRARRNIGIPENLQVMSPSAPSGEIPGLQANDGEAVEGHQDFIPADICQQA